MVLYNDKSAAVRETDLSSQESRHQQNRHMHMGHQHRHVGSNALNNNQVDWSHENPQEPQHSTISRQK